MLWRKRMANYEIIYSDPAREDLDRLPPRQAGQIVRKIRRLQAGLVGDIKRLQKHDVMYRLRMGDYRVLFDLEGGCIVIRRIKDRKEAYD
jgi:mRNA interferase RelE/StbE